MLDPIALGKEAAKKATRYKEVGRNIKGPTMSKELAAAGSNKQRHNGIFPYRTGAKCAAAVCSLAKLINLR